MLSTEKALWDFKNSIHKKYTRFYEKNEDLIEHLCEVFPNIYQFFSADSLIELINIRSAKKLDLEKEIGAFIKVQKKRKQVNRRILINA